MKNKKFRVLILAGGGYWGLIPIYFLSLLKEKYGEDFVFQKEIDCISGTSIGGVEACVLATGKDPRDLKKAFIENGKEIFKKTFKNKINPFSIPIYDSSYLENFIDNFISDTKIKKIKTKFPSLNFIVSSLNMTKNKPRVYQNLTHEDDNIIIKNIAMETSAAPMYFSFRENENGDCMADYGVRENIPIQTTATTIKSKYNIDFDEMSIFVLGTGKVIDCNYGTFKEINKWTIIDLASKFIIPDITSSNEEHSKFIGQNMGFSKFEIFNPVNIYGGMDDPSKYSYILEECKMYEEKFIDSWENFLK